MVSNIVCEARWDMIIACYTGTTWKFESIIQGQVPKIVEFLSNKTFLFGD